jgi:hypothetical protein
MERVESGEMRRTVYLLERFEGRRFDDVENGYDLVKEMSRIAQVKKRVDIRSR